MILSSEVAGDEVEEMIEFYRNHFSEVELVTCMACETNLCLQLRGGDPMGMQVNDLGYCVVPIGAALESTRVRLDESPAGERLMGYQCGAMIPNPRYPAAKAEHEKICKDIQAEYEELKAEAEKKKRDVPNPPDFPPLTENEFIRCGNDTRLAEAEVGLVPTGKSLIHMSPFERHKVRDKVQQSKKSAFFEDKGRIKVIDTFKIERIK